MLHRQAQRVKRYPPFVRFRTRHYHPLVHANVIRFLDAAASSGLELEVVHFDETTRTAADAAAAIGVEVDQIVKSLVFGLIHEDGTDETILALVAGSNRCDTDALAAAAEGARTHRVDADAARAATGYPIGGVPPFGHATPLRVFIDPHLLTHDVVWAAAGTPNDNFAIAPADLQRATGAVLAPIGVTG